MGWNRGDVLDVEQGKRFQYTMVKVRPGRKQRPSIVGGKTTRRKPNQPEKGNDRRAIYHKANLESLKRFEGPFSSVDL